MIDRGWPDPVTYPTTNAATARPNQPVAARGSTPAARITPPAVLAAPPAVLAAVPTVLATILAVWLSAGSPAAANDAAANDAAPPPPVDVATAVTLPAAEAEAPQATRQRLWADISYLASDELSGRDVGTPGIQLAAEYIAASFAEAGLDTALFDGTPWQSFSIPVNSTISGPQHNYLQLQLPSQEPIDGVLEQTFVPLAIGGNATAQGRLVFAGYGISAPELDYDDYAEIDVQGAIVLVIRKEPQGEAADQRFDGDRHTRHAFFDAKIQAAAQRGAAAVLLVNDPESVDGMIAAIERRRTAEQQSWQRIDEQLRQLPADDDQAAAERRQLQRQQQRIAALLDDFDRQRQLAAEGLLGIEEAGRQVEVDGLPVICIGQSLVDRLLQDQCGQSLEQIQQQIDQQVRPASRELAATVRLAADLSPATVDSSNVLGVLPGRGDLADQTVVVGAHYDHVGMGGVGSLAPGTIAIHHGADDNASGTAVLLSSVRKIQQRLRHREHHRRVLFIAFTGEERGLLGSEHYANHPRFPLSQTVAMVNLDMVGRLRNNDLTVYGVGTAPEFSQLLDRINQHTEFQLTKINSGYGPSDHQSFFTRKVPVLFFFTGLHNDYHRPSDTVDKINLNGMQRITEITSRLVGELATAAQRPTYQDTDRRVNIRHQGPSRAYLGVSLRPGPEEQLAAEATETAQPTGAIASAIAADSAAAAAGLQIGDRLLWIGGVAMNSLSDVIEAVQQREVGDQVEIVIERDGEQKTLQATLKLRPAAEK